MHSSGKRVTQPLDKNIHQYSPCPSCNGVKKRYAKICDKCKRPHPPERPDIFFVDGEPCRYLPLTKGFYAIVDISKYAWLMTFKWHATKGDKGCWYAQTKIKGKNVYLHRLLLKISNDELVDHANRNTLDYRISNLRRANNQQNAANQKIRSTNKSGYKGVSIYRQWQKTYWRATITVNGRQICLGYHSTKKHAAIAYNEAASKYFGEFATMNHISD